MHPRKWVALGGAALGAAGMGLAVKSFLPRRMDAYNWHQERRDVPLLDTSAFPKIDVSFLRCGSVTIPECIAVRGAFSMAPRVISYSAVLVHHPRATFLYDTGLCAAIQTYMGDQPLFFRQTTGRYVFEQSLGDHLKLLGMTPGDLSFALLSHLHWDHVSGIPDLPSVHLLVNRVEYAAANPGLFDAHHGLVRRFVGDNPLDLFDCAGPTYEGFRSSYDLFGDGSVVLVPLPGHTAGHTGMFITRSNGSRLFLLGDAAWVAQNYLRPAPMHPFIWSLVTGDDATACQTLIELHNFSRHHPEVPLIAAHDAAMQEAFTLVEGERVPAA